MRSLRPFLAFPAFQLRPKVISALRRVNPHSQGDLRGSSVRLGGRPLPGILGLAKSRVLYGRVRINFVILACPRLSLKPHSMCRVTKFCVCPLSVERGPTLQTPLRAGGLAALRELRVNIQSCGLKVEKQPSPAADRRHSNLLLLPRPLTDGALDADEGTEKPFQPWDPIASFTPEVKPVQLSHVPRGWPSIPAGVCFSISSFMAAPQS